MTKHKGVRKTDDLMRKLMQVPPAEVGKGEQKPKPKKRRKKKRPNRLHGFTLHLFLMSQVYHYPFLEFAVVEQEPFESGALPDELAGHFCLKCNQLTSLSLNARRDR